MKKNILILLLIASQAHATLQPASSLKGAPSNDPFIVYQWSLMPMDQYSEQDLDDIHSTQIQVDPKFSINWKNFDSQMKRDAIVAVIDSGINDSHPELKDHLLPGYNFVAKKAQDATIYDDDMGHGTHISGIMAAASNNQTGVAGFSGKIKIIPLKVYGAGDYKSNVCQPQEKTTDGLSPLLNRVVKAIDFAIANKADVINFSMGWPRIANADAVRAAFQRATDAGIVIVAAAGNDGHDAQIFPCAYKGVICVASMDMDGKMSSFSNRGGHVDIAAPGQEILSLWPQVLTSNIFGISGYEVESGTSQAAPMISAAAAVLRGIYPQESANQTRARLLMAAQNWDRSIAYGYLQMDKAVKASPGQLMSPVFKEVEVADVDPQTLKFTVPLMIEKGSSASPTVQVTSMQNQIQISQVKKISEKATEVRYEIQAQAKTAQAASKWAYNVIVNGRSFINQILLQFPIEKVTQTRVPFQVSMPEMIQANSFLTAYNPRKTAENTYWSYLKKEGGLQLSIWKMEDGKLTEKTLFLPGLTDPQAGFNLIAEDFDFDGVTDYLFVGVIKEQDACEQNATVKERHLIYLNSQLQITHDFKVVDNGAVSRPSYRNKSDISFVKFSKPGMKPLKVPLYWDMAWVPDEDKNIAFNNEPDYQAQRVYYYEPTTNSEVKVRTLLAGDFARLVREELQASVRLEIDAVALRIQSESEAHAGKANLIFSIGRGVNVTYYMMPIADLGQALPRSSSWTALPSSSINLANNIPTEAWNLSHGKVLEQHDFQTMYNGLTGRSVLWDGRMDPQGLKLQIPEQNGEQIRSLTKSYRQGNDRVTFFETTDYLRVQGTWNSRQVDGKYLIYRSTFLPGQFFSQSFVPVVASAQQTPGILVNNSLIFSNTISTYALDEKGQLSSPISRTFALPRNCSMRNPQINEQGYTRLLLLCKEATGYELRSLNLD